MRRITIHAPIRGFVAYKHGDGLVELPNRLLKNFFIILHGALAGVNLYMKDTSDNVYKFGTGTMWICGVFKHMRCSDTSAVGFAASRCTGVCTDAGQSSQVSLTRMTDRICAETMRPSSCNANSNGLVVMMWNPVDGACHNIMIAHVPLTIAADDYVVHRICFYEPWLKNFVALIGVLLCYCENFTAIDINGTEFTIESYRPVRRKANMLLGYGSDAFSFDDYTMTNYKSITPTVSATDGGSFYTIHIYTTYIPEQDETIYEIGLSLGIIDVNGDVHDTLILRHVNPDGYPLQAGKEYLIEILIHGE